MIALYNTQGTNSCCMTDCYCRQYCGVVVILNTCNVSTAEDAEYISTEVGGIYTGRYCVRVQNIHILYTQIILVVKYSNQQNNDPRRLALFNNLFSTAISYCQNESSSLASRRANKHMALSLASIQ